jgi:hypothetical protein
MSPEQAAGAETDARSDLFSLGACMYYALSGRLPFQGKNALAVLRSLALGRVDPLAQVAPHVDPELARIVEQALSPDAARRPPTAEAMGAALDAWIRKRELGPSQPYAFAPAAMGAAPEIRDTSPSAFEATAMTPLSGAHALGPTTPSGPPAAALSAPPITGHTGTTVVTVPPRASRRPLVAGAVLAVVGISLGVVSVVYVATRPSATATVTIPAEAGGAAPSVLPTIMEARVAPPASVSQAPPPVAPHKAPRVDPTANASTPDAGRKPASGGLLCMEDKECGSRARCNAGKCECFAGYATCGGPRDGCYSLQDSQNCGACGVKCEADAKCEYDPAEHRQRCVNCAAIARVTYNPLFRFDHCWGDMPNFCTNLTISNFACGSCGNRCEGGTTCKNGACVAP